MPKYTIGKVGKRWQYRAVLPNGEYKYFKSRKGEGKKAFGARIDAFEKKMEVNVDGMRFDDLFKAWYETWSPTVSESSRELMTGIYKNHIAPDFARYDVREITPLMLHRLLESKGKEGYAGSTLTKMLQCVSQPYSFAQLQLNEHGLINPAEVVSIRGLSQAKPKRRRVISPDDLKRFFKSAQSSKHFNYFRLLNATGLRPSEAAGLKLKDITDDGLKIRRGMTIRGLSNLKNRTARRTFPMTDEVRSILDDQIARLGSPQRDSWLFPSQGGTPSLNSIQLALGRICESTAVYKRGGRNGQKKLELLREPLHITLYDFRHTFATRSARILPAKTLQYLMGHSSISVTMRFYVGLEDQDIETALDLLNKNKLDKY